MKIANDFPYIVRMENIVKFTTPDGEVLTYEVMSTHLWCKESSNDAIFEFLGLNAFDMAQTAYGYTPYTSTPYWPEAKEDDFDALSSLVTELAKYCKVEIS